jgi:AraC-like DNA-binding protein
LIALGRSHDDFGTIGRMDPAALPAPAAPSDPALAALRSVPPALLQRLFDTLPDVVFFAKDAAGRYTHASRTLLDRLRLDDLSQLRGKRADEVFPAPLGQRFADQDDAVLQKGIDIEGQLELHLYPNRAPGWCLTHKFAWREAPPPASRRSRAKGAVIGLVGVSRDLEPSHRAAAHAALRGETYARVAQVVERMQRDHAEPLEIRALAADAGLSIAQLERLFVQLYRLGPRQWLARLRLESAMARLDGDETVADIAHACGYADHSAFTRQFRRTIGMSPREWRAMRAG